VYNDTSCVACHNLGGPGGGGSNSKNVDILSVSVDSAAQQKPVAPSEPPGPLADELAKIHPGFRTAQSVVLHRFGSAAAYASWRMDLLAMHGTPPPQGVSSPRSRRNPRADLQLAKVSVQFRTNPNASRPQGVRTGIANITRSQRNATALFGAGLIDSIPEKVIEEGAQETAGTFRETKGRVSRLRDGKIGRFGWKAQTASIEDFVLTACAVELGLEVTDHPQGGDPFNLEGTAPGLDLTKSESDALIAYVRSLPAPSQVQPADLAVRGAVDAGKELFTSVGCASCHKPNLGQVQGIYSDLLLHDMGEKTSDTGSYGPFRPSPGESPGVIIVDGQVQQASQSFGASRQEWRTPPLWGVRDSAPYLHDGRADTLEEAIALHEGQGEPAAKRYFQLTPEGRERLQIFLKSLAAPAPNSPTQQAVDPTGVLASASDEGGH
jgi:hypothetical protein